MTGTVLTAHDQYLEGDNQCRMLLHGTLSNHAFMSRVLHACNLLEWKPLHLVLKQREMLERSLEHSLHTCSEHICMCSLRIDMVWQVHPGIIGRRFPGRRQTEQPCSPLNSFAQSTITFAGRSKIPTTSLAHTVKYPLHVWMDKPNVESFLTSLVIGVSKRSTIGFVIQTQRPQRRTFSALVGYMLEVSRLLDTLAIKYHGVCLCLLLLNAMTPSYLHVQKRIA